jgi:type VI secretion system protein
MALRLRVISDQRLRLGDKSTFVFGVSGGSIGRSAENDWVLPDDMRYVSGRHARIVFHKGRYLLQDTSSNGTYVNDNDRPLGGGNPHELKTGDLLRIGEYHVQVSIDAATDFSLDDSALYATGATSSRRRAPAQSDLGASIRLENLLEASGDVSTDELKPVNAFGQQVSARTRALVRDPYKDIPVEPPAPPPETEVDEAAARRIARLAKAAAKQQASLQPTAPAPPAPPATHSHSPGPDNTAGLQAFCRGAGIGLETLPVDAHARMLLLAGQLVREALSGLKESNRTQQAQRNQMRVTWQKDPGDLLPSLERHSVEELIQELLKAHDSRRFDAVQWLRETFSNGRRHDNAMLEATRAAFIEFIGRLDPRDLATRFERNGRRKLGAQGQQGPQHWELYGEFYRSLCEMQPGSLPHVFVEAFAQNYEQTARDSNPANSSSDAA